MPDTTLGLIDTRRFQPKDTKDQTMTTAVARLRQQRQLNTPGAYHR
jgi:hypothetical protein